MFDNILLKVFIRRNKQCKKATEKKKGFTIFLFVSMVRIF